MGVTLDPRLGARIRQSGAAAGLNGLDSSIPWDTFKEELQEYLDREKERKQRFYGPPTGVHPLDEEQGDEQDDLGK